MNLSRCLYALAGVFAACGKQLNILEACCSEKGIANWKEANYFYMYDGNIQPISVAGS